MDKDYIVKSLASRLNRLARLVELNAPTNILVNELMLVDYALARVLNSRSPNPQAEPADERETMKAATLASLLRRLRDRTDTGDYRLTESGAYVLIQAEVNELIGKAILAHCEHQDCPWLHQLDDKIEADEKGKKGKP